MSAEPLREPDEIIRTRNLSRRFGRLVAVNSISFEVFRGDIFGFLGPNGSGKTTTIRMLLGLLRPSSGSTDLFGIPTTRSLQASLQRIGAIIETPAFYAYLTGAENVYILALAAGLPAGQKTKQRVYAVLELVGLQGYPRLIYRKYSLGMKQRLAIAAALIHDPELIMLDEPTNGLDPQGIIEIRELIKQLASSGKTIFLSSHLLAEVQQICTRVVIMNRGQVVVQGKVQDLLRDTERIEMRLAQSEQTQAALILLEQTRAQGAEWLRELSLRTDAQQRPYLVIGANAEYTSAITLLLTQHQLPIAEIHPQEKSLEEFFLQNVATPSTTGER